jgi:DNA excision repair protein ERCC-8
VHHPLETLPKGGPNAHKNGITAIHFYPFDSGAFTTSSYDHTLRIWSSEGLNLAASFDLDYVVYNHATSPIADHLLVACASQHPNIRLVDLKSGASTHTLAGHGGAVMAVAWSPKDEHVLASGGTDGTIRFWDVRRSASQLGCLDLEDSVGIAGYDGLGTAARHRERGRAHNGAVNGLVWTEDGRHIVSAGHDEKIRVWDVIKGANTLASFGPLVRNRELRSCVPCLAPSSLVASGKDILFYPSDKEILMFELFEGKMLKRLRTPGLSNLPTADRSAGKKSRVTELAWRHQSVEMYSAHGDGTIRVWRPRTTEDAWQEEQDDEEARREDEERRRKRKALEDIYNDVTKKRMMV